MAFVALPLPSVPFVDANGIISNVWYRYLSQGNTGLNALTGAPAIGFDSLAPTTTEGDLIYYHSGTNARLPIGASTAVLTSNGTDPAWVTPGASPASWAIVEQASNLSVTSSAALANSSLTFAVAANTKYRFRIFAFVTCGTTGGWQTLITGPASPTAIVIGAHLGNSAAANLDFSTTTFAGSAANETGVTSVAIVFYGVLQNGSTSGSVTLQFAQEVSNGTASVLLAPSWLEWSAA